MLNAMRAMYDEADPVPSGLVERIQFEITLDALEAELATLMQLDLADAGARGTATEAVRTITFTSESLTTMVTLTPQPGGSGPGRRLGGARRRHPGRGAAAPADPRETCADEDGRFVFDALPSGLAKFALHLETENGSSTVMSPTIEL